MKKVLFLLTAFYSFLTPLQAALPHDISGGQNSIFLWPAGEDSAIINSSEDFKVNSKFPGSLSALRSSLSGNGIDFSLIFAGDAFSTVSGGNQARNDFLYRADLKMTFDFEKLLGWDGAAFYADIMGTEGGKPSEASGAGQGISNIEAPDAWKIYEFYITQSFLDNRLSLLLGTFDLNSEFDTRLSSSLFLNPSHGIGPDYSQSGVNGPSIFPTASLAFRAKYSAGNFSILAAVFDGIPGNPENHTGTHIILNKDDGLLFAGEAGYMTNDGDFSAGYQKFSVGGWFYSSKFSDITDAENLPGLLPKNNYGIYFQGEKFLVSEKHDPSQGLAAFLRYGFAQRDVNKYSDYLGVGANYIGLFPDRDSDILGLGIAAVKNSAKFIKSMAMQEIEIKNYEVNIELTYQMQILESLLIQPDFQYVVNPVFAPEKTYSLNFGLRAQLTL